MEQNLRNNNFRFLFFTLFLVVFASFSQLTAIPYASAARNSLEANVLIFSRTDTSRVITSLKIDKETIKINGIITPNNISEFSFSDIEDLLIATDVIVVDRFLPNDADLLHLLVSHVNGTSGSCGLIMLGLMEGDIKTPQINILYDILPIELTVGYQNSTKFTESADYKIQTHLIDNIPVNTRVLTNYIPWISLPAVAHRTLVTSKASATEILESIDGTYTLFAEWNLTEEGYTDAGSVSFISIELNEANLPVSLWPYFNYLMYIMIFHMDNDSDQTRIESYPNWPYAPIPQGLPLILWFIMIGGLWIISGIWIMKMKKAGKHYSLLSIVNKTTNNSNNVTSIDKSEANSN
jgi:hypothetical protein